MSKGSILDLFSIIFIFSFIVVSLFLVFKVFEGIKNNIKIENEIESNFISKTSTSFNIFVNSIPIVVTAAGVGSIILAFMIPTHPVFLPASVLLLVFFIVVSTTMKTFVFTFLSSEQMASLSNQFPFLASFLNNFPLVIGVVGFLIIIVMYFKRGSFE